MVPIAEDALLNEKFSLQGTSTGKISGRTKVVCIFLMIKKINILLFSTFDLDFREF